MSGSREAFPRGPAACSGSREAFLQSLCQLVRTGGVFITAPDAFKGFDDFFCFAADDQFADSLEISVAPARETDGTDNMIPVYVQIDLTGTGTFCSVNHLIDILPYYSEIIPNLVLFRGGSRGVDPPDLLPVVDDAIAGDVFLIPNDPCDGDSLPHGERFAHIVRICRGKQTCVRI